MEGGIDHGAVVVAVDLVEIGVLVAYELHHAGEILILVETAVELKLTIATDEHQRRTVGAHPVEGRILVDGGLKGLDALHLAHIIMGDGLAAEGDVLPHAVGIDLIAL